MNDTTDHQMRRVIELYGSMPPYQIAQVMGLSITRVYNLAARARRNIPHLPRATRYPYETIIKVLGKRAKGLSARQVAEETFVSQNAVQKLAKQYGLPSRVRPNPKMRIWDTVRKHEKYSDFRSCSYNEYNMARHHGMLREIKKYYAQLREDG